MDEYVYPNLGGTEAFVNMSTVMMLISELQADEVAIPFVQLTLLLEIVLPFLNTGPEEVRVKLQVYNKTHIKCKITRFFYLFMFLKLLF